MPPQSALSSDVYIDLRGSDVLVTQQFLDRPDVRVSQRFMDGSDDLSPFQLRGLKSDKNAVTPATAGVQTIYTELHQQISEHLKPHDQNGHLNALFTSLLR